MLLGMATMVSAIDVHTNENNSEPVALSLAQDKAVQTASVIDEEYLVLRGNWAKESKYQLKALVDGKRAKRAEVRWRVDADSYQNEFGFTGDLNGDEIVSVNAETGEITVKNSGIVRVWCESTENPESNFSVVVVVPGDVNKDGSVDFQDVDMLVDIATWEENVPDEDANDSSTWFLNDLANLSDDSDAIDMDDVTYLVEIIENLRKI